VCYAPNFYPSNQILQINYNEQTAPIQLLHPTKSTKKTRRDIPNLSVQVRQIGISLERRQALSLRMGMDRDGWRSTWWEVATWRLPKLTVGGAVRVRAGGGRRCLCEFVRAAGSVRVRAGAGVWLVDLSPWIELGITYAYILSQKQCRIKLSHTSNVSAVVSHKGAMLLVLGSTPTDVLFFGFSVGCWANSLLGSGAAEFFPKHTIYIDNIFSFAICIKYMCNKII
jgi:hypothetical protein